MYTNEEERKAELRRQVEAEMKRKELLVWSRKAYRLLYEMYTTRSTNFGEIYALLAMATEKVKGKS